MSAKNRYINLRLGMLYAHWLVPRTQSLVLQHIVRVLKFLDIEKSYIKISVFSFFGGKHFWKIRDSHLKDLLILRLSVLLTCTSLKISIFDDFSNICQFPTKKIGMTSGHLNRYNSKSFRENFRNLVYWSQIDVRKGMLNVASIPVTLRMLFKEKPRGRIRRLQAVAGQWWTTDVMWTALVQENMQFLQSFSRT